jgi:hypothetical protein
MKLPGMKFLFPLALLVVIGVGVFSCKQIKQMANFTQCEFRMSTVENTNLAGVNVQQIQSYSDLTLMDVGKLTAAYAKGTLPLSLTLNVEGKNPNKSTAAMNKLEWILVIDEKDVVSGTLNDKVTLAPEGGVATIPLRINADLRKILAGKSAKETADLGLGLVGGGNKPSKKLGLKIKPSIMIGSLTIPYPGYITIGTNFGAGK